MERVRFYYDFISPYTYLATTQLDALGARTGAEIVWIPAYLSGIMKATGNQPPLSRPGRMRSLPRDLTRWAAFYGVPFKMTPYFPLNSLNAMRAACALAAERPAAYRPFVDACFRASWEEERNLGDPAVWTSLAGEEHRAFVTEAAGDQAWKDALKKNTDEAVAAGIFGLPAFVVGDDEHFFGNDRLALLEWTLTHPAT